ncbi:nitroreductase family protein [Peptococcus simiae]|uniref:nitroreductase family protein n=1 Tax=Peptococcus simiae TaxID=1643805 RepID=UPI00397F2B50
MSTPYNDLLTRRSIRAYLDRQVPEDLLEQVLEAGLYAPTARDNQKAQMVVVQDPDTLADLEALNAREMTSAGGSPFYGAPTCIIVFADGEDKNWIQDGSLVMGNLMNAAHSLGLGSCWINRAMEVFDGPEGKAYMEKWGIPAHYRAVANCILGYVKGDAPTAHPRKEGRIKRF